MLRWFFSATRVEIVLIVVIIAPYENCFKQHVQRLHAIKEMKLGRCGTILGRNIFTAHVQKT